MDDVSCIDFSLMDELLFDGFWLETKTTTDNLNFWPSTISQSSFLGETEKQLTDISSHHQQMDHQLLVPLVREDQEEEVNNARLLWVGPNNLNPIRSISVKKRLLQAVNNLKESIIDKDVLIQIWVPVKKGGRQVLTTKNQPFSLDPNSKNLADYRDVSRSYQFAADQDSSKEFFGLPGRVFLNKLPEWTPDVRFFKREEYPRVNHAQRYGVKGSLALPVFERSSGCCLGVVEIVTTSQKINYHPELENICKALEAVDLKSSTLSPPNVEDCDESYQAAVEEIRNVLRCVCDEHELPLAQTWAPCIQQRKGGCRHSDENYLHCVSTIDSACYVADQKVQGFHEACSKHHLLKGEGVVGKAFLTNQACFSGDVTAFSKTDYPLAHHARVFDLCAAVAIRLRSTYIETSDFVLEFFLPINCRDDEEQTRMLDSLSTVIKRTCQSLRVVTDRELGREDFPLDDVDKKPETVTFSKERSPDDWANDSRTFSLSGGGHRPKTSTAKRKSKAEKTISLEVLRQYFAGSLKDAAKNIGVCPTTLKRICRQHGITRWPSRKLKKVGHSLRKLQLVIDSVQGTEGSIPLTSFYNKFPELASSNVSASSQLPVSNTNDGLKTDLLSPSKSPSSSGNHSSSSSHCCSTGEKQPPSFSGNGMMLKRTRSDADLMHDSIIQEDKKLLVRSYSNKIIFRDHNEAPPLLPRKADDSVGTFRVKAAFGEENIRFSLQPNWGFEHLQNQVLRRFNMDNGSGYNLKYLDDDFEWVLLTCDADLEECLDIHRLSKSRTIKLCLNNQYHHPSLGSSFGSNGPF